MFINFLDEINYSVATQAHSLQITERYGVNMAKSDIHEPKQKRSIEKKKHIMMVDDHYFSIDQTDSDSIDAFASVLLDRFLSIHTDNWDMHEELEAMRHSDKKVAALYDKAETTIIMQLTNDLRAHGDSRTNLSERVYAAFHLIEGYCREYPKVCVNLQTDVR